MVGVAGKFKGCETCRRRRVKCDNTRPLCKKCVDNGRDCEGYQRERVFITAGVEQRGRCSSHPRRTTGGSSTKSKSQTPEAEENEEEYGYEQAPQFASSYPPQPEFLLEQQQPGATAWSDTITLSSRGAQHVVPVVAFHADLRGMLRASAADGRFTVVEGPAYPVPDFRMPFAEAGLEVGGHCLVHIPDRAAGGNLCAFVFEHSAPLLSSGGISPWGSDLNQTSTIQTRGPESVQFFPAHHFFARIYRPHTIGMALLNRRETFLASPEWTTTPWQIHPKSLLDSLLDTLAFLPSLFARSDTLLSQPPSPPRQHHLHELFTTCLRVERRLDAWYAAMMATGGPGCRLNDQDADLQIPFGGGLVFSDGASALMCIYYWTALLLFHRCVLAVHRSLFQHGYQYGGGSHQEPAPAPVINEQKYQQGRQLAGKICQSLDFALGSTPQPDLLVVPLTAAERFYAGIKEVSGQGTLELFWCERFRERLGLRGESLAGFLHGREWVEVGSFRG
ncbi:uncharacterized protein DNG_07212 [Cephalotrichum gorgonifer]|uniref:Zn(2)-C6 fungal-type domain-containing protein n=1 Tax=Cephalotrichum gorgonifer TaxID=2041049 RepID=A0AAE8N454_9PEZI|nr:uncharacterized protein DNG_07212 [Cephalotrichum gorgonifer]